MDTSANFPFYTALLSLFQGTLLAIAGTYVTYMYFGLQVELKNIYSNSCAFSFQTGFVFANQASGVKEEYLFFHNRSDLNKPDACGGDQQGCPKFELPKWLDCSEEANLKRDYYKALFEVRLDFSADKCFTTWNRRE